MHVVFQAVMQDISFHSEVFFHVPPLHGSEHFKHGLA